MKPETQFVLDWLKAYVALTNTNTVGFTQYETVLSPCKKETVAEFRFGVRDFGVVYDIRLSVPVIIRIECILRALLELEDGQPLLASRPTHASVKNLTGFDDGYETLRKTT